VGSKEVAMNVMGCDGLGANFCEASLLTIEAWACMEHVAEGIQGSI